MDYQFFRGKSVMTPPTGASRRTNNAGELSITTPERQPQPPKCSRVKSAKVAKEPVCSCLLFASKARLSYFIIPDVVGAVRGRAGIPMGSATTDGGGEAANYRRQ